MHSVVYSEMYCVVHSVAYCVAYSVLYSAVSAIRVGSHTQISSENRVIKITLQ
jgi:hypothetical protein